MYMYQQDLALYNREGYAIKSNQPNTKLSFTYSLDWKLLYTVF